MKKLLLVAFVVLLGIAASGIGSAAATNRACTRILTFEGWDRSTTGCTFTPGGEQLIVWTAGAAGGVALAPMVPGPPILIVRVSVESMDGTVLHTCSSSYPVTAQCSRAVIGIDRSEPLRCVAQAWSNMNVGRGALVFGCAAL